MTLKKHSWYAVVIFWGCLALGDDHLPGNPQVSCSTVPFDCIDECEALNACLSIPENEPFFDCAAQYSALEGCRVSPPPGRPPVVVVIPPPACPPGQHLTEGGQCQADYECGDDQIGGGETPCETCGDGRVPNYDGKTCRECPLGEELFEKGQCRCEDNSELDPLARTALSGIPDEPWERGGWLACGGASPSISNQTYSSKDAEDKCELDRKGNFGVGRAASFHSHPVFEWPRDEGKVCAGDPMETPFDVLSNNTKGLGHSGADIIFAKAGDIPSYLTDSVRSQYVYRKNDEGEWGEEPL